MPAPLSNLESMCAKLRPDAPPAQKRGPLGFRPTDALVAASFYEYLQILSAVLLLALKAPLSLLQRSVYMLLLA
jgi:hypothetical protein